MFAIDQVGCDTGSIIRCVCFQSRSCNRLGLIMCVFALRMTEWLYLLKVYLLLLMDDCATMWFGRIQRFHAIVQSVEANIIQHQIVVFLNQPISQWIKLT